MSEKNKLTVKIHGFEYKLISDDPKNYMKSVANYVDTRMNDIAAANKKLSTSMIAVLTALNIADDHFRLKEECEAIKELLADQSGQPIKKQEKIQNIEVETDKRSDDYEAISKEFKRVLEHASKYQTEIESLKDKLRILSFELENKEDALAQSQRTIDDLQIQLDASNNR